MDLVVVFLPSLVEKRFEIFGGHIFDFYFLINLSDCFDKLSSMLYIDLVELNKRVPTTLIFLNDWFDSVECCIVYIVELDRKCFIGDLCK